MMEAQVQRFRRLFDAARHVVVLTGAGVSAESGVPTFRGAAGFWRKFDPTLLATPQAFARDPSTVWEWYHWRRSLVAKCKPNAAHYALAAAQERAAAAGRQLNIITQNIDGLHQDAGAKRVVELHGSLWKVCRATSTGQRDGPAWEDRAQPLVPALAGAGDPEAVGGAVIPEDELPRDPATGRLLRPAVVWFNERLEPAVADAVEAALDACDLLVIAGTSSVVYPAAGYAPHVAARGAAVVEVNLDPTDNTSVCALAFHGKAGELLPRLLGVEDDARVAAAVKEAAAAAAAAAAEQQQVEQQAA
jgi:NAD-dependent deacetylase sirtuin 5